MKYAKFHILLLFTVLSICSCGLFISDDEFLTEAEWIIYTSWTDSSFSNTTIVHHKLADKDLILKFNPNGTVKITENAGEKSKTINWNWKKNDKEKIQMEWGRFQGDFNVIKLNSKELHLLKTDIGTDFVISKSWVYHHADGEWNDELAEEMNNKGN